MTTDVVYFYPGYEAVRSYLLQASTIVTICHPYFTGFEPSSIQLLKWFLSLDHGLHGLDLFMILSLKSIIKLEQVDSSHTFYKPSYRMPLIHLLYYIEL